MSRHDTTARVVGPADLRGAIMVPLDKSDWGPASPTVRRCSCAGSNHASRTRAGAARYARSTARHVGRINVQRQFTLTWAICWLIAVIAGVCGVSSPEAAAAAVLVGLRIFPIVIIGGLDSIVGTIASP